MFSIKFYGYCSVILKKYIDVSFFGIQLMKLSNLKTVRTIKYNIKELRIRKIKRLFALKNILVQNNYTKNIRRMFRF